MANDRYVNRDDDFLDPEDVNSEPAGASANDPAAEVPVPLAMTPAEVEERARAVEAVRSRGRARPDRDDSGMIA
ncbi:MAG TPA: hypothetical protein VHB25_10300 [Gemmatimonadaceae bacterium]|nr:hypothetical protein [Gemmatimonadaceae bacterium]